jgi:hypothetical protein
MRLTLELLHHRLTVAIEHDEPKPERHEHPDLDALVERSGNDRDSSAELDHRPRPIGFHS